MPSKFWFVHTPPAGGHIPRADFSSFCPPPPYLVGPSVYHIEACTVLFQKQLQYGFATQTDFELGPIVCKEVNIVQIRL